MAKRAELPKANAFFGGASPATREAVAPSHEPAEAAAVVSEGATELPLQEAPPEPVAVETGRGATGTPEAVAPPEAVVSTTTKDGGGDVEKVTLYLPPDIIRQLEVTRVDLLVRYGAKVNRSRIAAAILRQTLEDISQHHPTGDRLMEALTRA